MKLGRLPLRVSERRRYSAALLAVFPENRPKDREQERQPDAEQNDATRSAPVTLAHRVSRRFCLDEEASESNSYSKNDLEHRYASYCSSAQTLCPFHLSSDQVKEPEPDENTAEGDRDHFPIVLREISEQVD